MDVFTFEERNLVCIYNTGMKTYLQEDEEELRALTDSVIGKLTVMTDDAFSELELYPDF